MVFYTQVWSFWRHIGLRHVLGRQWLLSDAANERGVPWWGEQCAATNKKQGCSFLSCDSDSLLFLTHTHTHTHTHSNFLFFFSFLFFNFYNIVMVSAVQQCKISHQFSSVQSLSRLGLCDSMNRSMPGLPVDHQLPESTIIITVSPRHPEPPSLPASRSSQSTRLGSLCFAAISPQLST